MQPYPPPPPPPGGNRRWIPAAIISAGIIIAGVVVGGAVMTNGNRADSKATNSVAATRSQLNLSGLEDHSGGARCDSFTSRWLGLGYAEH